MDPIKNGDIPACYVSLPEGKKKAKSTRSTRVSGWVRDRNNRCCKLVAVSPIYGTYTTYILI